MLNKNRMKSLTDRLAEAWEQIPSLRLGQLISNSAWPQDLFYMTDEDMVERVENWVNKNASKLTQETK